MIKSLFKKIISSKNPYDVEPLWYRAMMVALASVMFAGSVAILSAVFHFWYQLLHSK